MYAGWPSQIQGHAGFITSSSLPKGFVIAHKGLTTPDYM